MDLSHIEYEGVDFFHLALSEPRSCEQDNETLVSINDEEFLQ
jgi:hypothetical protein